MASKLHRVWRSRRRPFAAPPVLVVGSLHSGGTCKTDLVDWIAARHAGLAILVHPTTDEAAWLASRHPGRVFVHSDFLDAWGAARRAGFVAAVCDGGLQDPALDHCTALCLDVTWVPSALAELLPFGSCRELAPSRRSRLRRTSVESELCPALFLEDLPEPKTEVVAACSIARPERFFADLERQGLVLLERFAFRDHAVFSKRTVHNALRKHPGTPWVVTEKDASRGELGRLPAGSMKVRRTLAPTRHVTRFVDDWMASI